MSAYSDAVLADTPAGYWRLDDSSSVTAVDGSGGGNPGTYQRTGHVAVRQAGAAAGTYASVNFSGGGATSGYISVPDAVALRLSGDHSLEAWFITSASSTAQMILSKYTNSGAFAGYGLRVNTTGKVGYWLGDVWQEPATNYRGAWHHVVATLSGTTGTIYIDGSSVSTATRAASMTTSSQFLISNDPGLGQGFDGNLDEVAIYGYALSAAQVTAHFNAASVSPPPQARTYLVPQAVNHASTY